MGCGRIRYMKSRAIRCNHRLGSHGYEAGSGGNSDSGGAAFRGRGRIVGSGEMAALVRSHARDQTALAPLESWSDQLVCSVNLMLACGFPSLVFWGPEMVQFRNDKGEVCGTVLVFRSVAERRNNLQSAEGERVELRRPDGESMHMHFSCPPVLGQQGQVI
jgi:hypothetical protein